MRKQFYPARGISLFTDRQSVKNSASLQSFTFAKKIYQSLCFIFSPFLILSGLAINGFAQAPIVLDRCDFPYIDPQDANGSGVGGRDSLIYTEYFQEDSLLKSFHVDVNAFGGQQVDRTSVYAILPDSSLQLLGSLAFGNCPECVTGFALVENGVLQVQDVPDRATMDRYIQSFNQPPFKLTNNLQTLRGVGRISGRIPFCAIGWQVQYSVYSAPGMTSTEFSTYILCPKVEAQCPIVKTGKLDCQKDSIYLTAPIPQTCFSTNTKIRWYNNKGWSANTANAQLSATGNLGMFYLSVEDGGCVKTDSILVDSPPFLENVADQKFCQNATVTLASVGGFGHFWVNPDGMKLNDSILIIPNIKVNQSGAYVLHAFNVQNCEATDTVHVTVQVPPSPIITFVKPCLGDTLKINVLNDSIFATLNWLTPNGTPFNPPFIANFQATDAGNYTLIAKDSLGCEIQKDTLINGSAPPNLTFDIIESCDTSKVLLLPENYNYAWENGVRGNIFKTNTGGKYRVTVTDSIGCASITEIDIPQPDGPNVTLKVEQPFCPGDYGTIEVIAEDADRALIFSKDGGLNYSLSSKFEKLAYGKYNIAIQDDVGCIQRFEREILTPDTVGVSLNIDSLEVRPNTLVILTGETEGSIRLYQWVPQGIDTGTPFTAFTANQDLNVRLIVEDQRGCRATAGFFLRIVLGEIYAPDAFSPNADGQNDYFTLFSDNLSGEIMESLYIFDRWGNLLFAIQDTNLNDPKLGWDGTYKGKPMNPGVYTYQAIIRFGNGVRKLKRGDVTLVR